jgi:hypothetical protein
VLEIGDGEMAWQVHATRLNQHRSARRAPS